MDLLAAENSSSVDGTRDWKSSVSVRRYGTAFKPHDFPDDDEKQYYLSH
jgi:hypothetical protein